MRLFELEKMRLNDEESKENFQNDIDDLRKDNNRLKI